MELNERLAVEQRPPAFDEPRKTCALCGSNHISYYHRDHRGISIFRCGVCGGQFMNPVYSDDHLREYYSHYVGDGFKLGEEESELYCHDYYLSLVERFMAASPGRLLDVGTGAGLLLKAAQRRRWQVVGYDVDPATVQSVGSKLNVEIRTGRFNEMTWPADSFDAVIMHHVLEHVKEPRSYLDTIRKLLRPGGILFVASPNLASVSSSLKRWMEKAHLRRKRVGAYYDTVHHLCYFSPASLRRLLSQSGFEPLLMRSGHQARPFQSAWTRWLMRNVTERLPWKSTILVVARKPAAAPNP